MMYSEWVECFNGETVPNGSFELGEALYANNSGVCQHGGRQGHLEAYQWVQANPQLAGAIAEMVVNLQHDNRKAQLAMEGMRQDLDQRHRMLEAGDRRHQAEITVKDETIRALTAQLASARDGYTQQAEEMHQLRQKFWELESQVAAFKAVIRLVGEAPQV